MGYENNVGMQPELVEDPEAQRLAFEAETEQKVAQHQIELADMTDEQRAEQATMSEASSAFGAGLANIAQEEFDAEHGLDKAA